MLINLYHITRYRAGRALILLLVAGSSTLAAQQPCPPEAASEVTGGWRAYRADSIPAAERHFTRADQACPHNLDAKVGLGYTALRQGAVDRADSLFRLVVTNDWRNADAWAGLALAANRKGNVAAAVEAARNVLEINPGDVEARALLDQLSPGWNEAAVPPPNRPATLQVVARTRRARFEIPSRRGWTPFYIRGINLGAALPGKFPSEFPADSAGYTRWLAMMAGMNANTVRLYTILPPEFYRALRGWNLSNPRRPLWLIHGVWTELPPDHDFNDGEWKSAFRQEMRRVVDLLHGAIEIPIQPGHAGGRYDADVSRWTLAYIIGREWEPYAVKAFAQAHPGLRSYRGQYLETRPAPAADTWMAEQCDYLLAYEVRRFNAIRPIAYANWPTLDPLVHPTESTTDEESEWRRRMGRPANLTYEYENDAVGLDANLIRPTPANPAGWFASYHAYPYYPDFILHDRRFREARSTEGRSNYFGYLRELKRHHGDIPIVIAEYGVPSSRGIAHFQPQGWNHGGHDEVAMARIDARLTREIHESGAAGGILFAWIDEWFKQNWMVIDLEIPGENTRLWHNAMDAEQHYGVIGMYAGESESTPQLGGKPERWLAGDRLYQETSNDSGQPGSIHVRSDESYIYLAVGFPRWAGRQFPWDSLGVMIALDTYLPHRGQHVLPGRLLESEIGFEFLIEMRSPDDATIGILPEYNPHGSAPDSTRDDVGKFYHRPVTIVDRGDGNFDSLYVTTNRARYGRDGTFYPAVGYNRGRLRFGTDSSSTLSDWYYDADAGLLEIRIPWGLLNVADPSSATVLYETTAGESFGTVRAEGFRIGVVTYRDGAQPTLLGALPRVNTAGSWQSRQFRQWMWQTWETPTYHERVKPVYAAMKETWGRMVPR